jgi:uncharacterized protein
LKRIAASLFCLYQLFLGCSGAFGQDTSLFYEVTGNGLPGPSYLYGTFHMVCPADLAVSEGTKRAFAATQQLYLELDLDDPTQTVEMQKAIALPVGKTARDYLTHTDYDLLDTYLRKASGIGMDLVGNVKPLGLTSLIYMGMLNCEPESYDLTFAQLAKDTQKEVHGLESLEAQLTALDKKPLDAQYAELVSLARNPADAQMEFRQLLAAYKTGDLTKLSVLIKTSRFSGDAEAMEENLLNARNIRWLPIMEQALKTKPTFFAFGAAHLIGEKGVVALLRQQGYTVLNIVECYMKAVR